MQLCESLAVGVVEQTQSSLERDVLVKRCRESEEELRHMEVCWGRGEVQSISHTQCMQVHLSVLCADAYCSLCVVLPCRVCAQI